MKKRRSGLQVMMKLIGLVRPLTGYMVLAVLMGLLGHLCASFITICAGFAVLEALGQFAALSMPWIFALMIVLAAARAFLRYGEQKMNHYIAFKLLARIRDKVFGALRRLAPAKLDGRDKGNLISVITSDVELLEVFYAHTISPVLIALLYSVIMIFFIGSYDARLGLIAAAAYAVIGILVPVLISKASGSHGSSFREKQGGLSSFVLESLRGLTEILQYGQGEARLLEMNAKTDELTGDEQALKAVAGRNSAFTGALILIFDLIMLFTSARLMQKGVFGFPGVLIPTLALFSSFGPVSALAALGSTLQNTFAAGDRVIDILEEEPVTKDISGMEKAPFGEVDAKDVCFAYGDEEILTDFNVKIKPGQITGITGKSGSGKSTFLKLLMRFREAQGGAIAIAGRNINAVNTKDLREMESYVTQETHLFHDTIKNNLLIANPRATDDEIQAACKKASVHDFIEGLGDGYNTQVGELGDTLSGGERQRLGLARAFLHDSDLMLLDEPTSNLDSLNEAVILRSLDKQRSGKTVVLVSHRKSTMGIADSVYSVENGKNS